MDDKKNSGDPRTATSDGDSAAKREKPRIDWADPGVPIGNAPPLPRWPLAFFGIAWLAWVALLVVMMLSRGQATV